MGSNLLPIIAIGFLFFDCLFLAYREKNQARRHRLRVKKLYASPVFEDLLPLLTVAKRRHIEQVTIDKTGILFTYMAPVGSHAAFLLKRYGYAYFSFEQQEAMRTLLEECLPKLRDRKRYRARRKRVMLVNGDVEYVFRYTMQNSYKTMLNRAPYYDAALQAKLR